MGIFDRFKSDKKAKAQASQASDSSTDEAVSSVADQTDSSTSGPPVESVPAKSVTKKPKGLFARIKSGLQKTSQLLNTDVRDLFKKEGQLLDDEMLERLTATLIKTDMGVSSVKEIVSEIGLRYRGRVVHSEDIVATIKEKLKAMMAQDKHPIIFAESGPTVIMVCGVNGSGKTTTIAKLTRHFKSAGKKVVLGAADTFRAAAVEQLTVWASRLGAEIVKGSPGQDPASVAHRAVATAIEQQAGVCIIDTAGRLQTQQNLMSELSKIHRVISKQIPEAPHEVILVLDATAGQNGISQARGFTEAVQCTGIVLAKLDGTAKGGVVVPIRKEFDLPVKYIGIGETSDDLAVFDHEAFVDALFDQQPADEVTLK